MRKPSEITDDEWDSLTSPENYHCDGEVSRADADRLFRQKVEKMVASRRAKARTTAPRPETGAEKCPVDTMVFNKGHDEAQSRRLLNAPRKQWVGARRVRKIPKPTNAAAVSRVLKSAVGEGYLVTQIDNRLVMVRSGKGSPGLHRATQVLAAKGYAYSANGQHIVISGRCS